jgi:hypothetical protein
VTTTTSTNTSNRIYRTIRKKLENSKKILKYQSKGKRFGETSEIIEEFCYVIFITDGNMHSI